MVDHTWPDLELPLLLAVRRHERETGEAVKSNGALREMYRDDGGEAPDVDVAIAIGALVDAGHLTSVGREAMGTGRRDDDHLRIELTPEGRRTIGQWPGDDAYELLLMLLAQRVEETDGVERTRWADLRASLRAVGEQGVAGILASAASAAAGL